MKRFEQRADEDGRRHEQEMADAPADVDVLVIADVDEEVEDDDATASAPKIAEAAALGVERRNRAAPPTISTGPKLRNVTHQKSCTATRLTVSSTTEPLLST